MSNLPFLFDNFEGGSEQGKQVDDRGFLSPDIVKISQQDFSSQECPLSQPDDTTLKTDIKHILSTYGLQQITHKLIKKMLEHKYQCSLDKKRVKGIVNEALSSFQGSTQEKPTGETEVKPITSVTAPKIATKGCSLEAIKNGQTLPSFNIGHELTPRIRLPFWIMSNQRGFTNFLNKEFTKGYLNSSLTQRGDITVKSHQRFVSEFIQSDSPYRGLLLYHGLGSGKTAASLFIADGIPDKQIIIMLPASIEDNYRGEIRKYSSIKDRNLQGEIENHWCFYPLQELKSREDVVKLKSLLLGHNSPNISDKLLKLILVDRGVRYSKRSKKWQITYRDDDAEKYKVLGSFKTKQEADDNYDIVIETKKIKTVRFGIWLVNQDQDPNFSRFDKLDQEEIKDTINRVYQYKYNFIRYNAGRALLKNNSGTGLFDLLDSEDREKIRQQFNINFSRQDTWDRIKIGKSNWAFITSLIIGGRVENPFNNKVVVVDEIHNFVSKIVGSGYTCKALYILMMTSKNSKFVFLSGTPAINDPFELGVLFNILRGTSVNFPFRLDNNNPANREKVARIFQQQPSIDYYSIEDMGKISYTLNPYGFINSYGAKGNRLGVAKARRITMEIDIVSLDKQTDNVALSDIQDLLTQQGGRLIIPPLPQQSFTKTIILDSLEKLVNNTFGLLNLALEENHNIINLVISGETENRLKLKFTFHNIPEIAVKKISDKITDLVIKTLQVDTNQMKLQMPQESYMEPIYNNTSNEDFTKTHLEHILNKEQIKVIDLENETYMGPFPCFSGVRKINEELDLAKKDFSNSYINFTDNSVKNRENFKINTLGLVSYFRETTETDQYGNSIFPDNLLSQYETGGDITSTWDLTGIRLVNCTMSNYQFIKYSEAREIEREMEFSKTSKGNIQSNFTFEQQLNALSQNQEKSSSYFKVMSRNCLLFVFPPELERQWPKDIKARLKAQEDMMEALYGKENEDADADEEATEAEGKGKGEGKGDEEGETTSSSPVDAEKLETYREMKSRILDNLTRENLTVNETPYNLSVLSPKYVDIFNNLQVSPGLIMCYSQFRTVEGIEVFRRVLEAYGYSPFETEDTSLKPIKLGKTMTRLCLSREGDRLSGSERGRVKDKTDPYGEQIWITAFPGSQRHPNLTNYISYSVKQIRETLQQSLAFNGKTETTGEKTTFIPTRTEVEISLKINQIIGALQEKYLEKLRAVDPEAAANETRDNQKLWIEEVDSETGERNIFPAQYGIFTKKEGKAILEVQQAENNKYGQQMQILFITLAGAEGLSLKNIRMVHIMEPFWNMVKINQVIGRARRNYSHQTLPLDQRNVRIYEYIGKFSTSQLSGSWSSQISYQEILSSESIESESQENLQRYALEKAKKYTVDVTNQDNNLTSDEFLLEISKRKDKIMSGFLSLIKESAIDCQLNKAVNQQGDPFAAEMVCENSNRFPVIEPIGSQEQFIRIPGKNLQGVVLETSSDLPAGKHLITFPISNQFGNFKISAILDGDQGVLYDVYYYYGLDPTLKGPSYVYKPIGTANNVGGELEISIVDNFFKVDDLGKLERYTEIEKVRKQLEEMPNSKFIGLPKSPNQALSWINAIRNHQELKQYTTGKRDKVTEVEKGSSVGVADSVEEGKGEDVGDDKSATQPGKTPYQILGVSEDISPIDLKKLANSKDLSPEKKKAISDIIKSRRSQRKK